MLRSSALILFAALLALPASLRADSFTYTYTGNRFTFVSAVYTKSDYLSGSFTLSSALAPNLTSLTAITPGSFSFSDGVFAISSKSSLVREDIEVETDATGAITQWQVNLAALCSGCYTPGNNPGYFVTLAPENEIHTANSALGAGDIDFSDVSYYENAAHSIFAYQAGNGASESVGTWSLTRTTAVPEPASLMLVSTGFLMLVHRASRSRSIRPA